jgi:hypothetical protein
MILESAQAAATQAANQSHLFLDGGMLVIMATQAGLVAKAILDYFSKKKAGKVHRPCDEHDARIKKIEDACPATRIAVIETNYESLKTTIEQVRRENREDHKAIFDQLRDIAKQ